MHGPRDGRANSPSRERRRNPDVKSPHGSPSNYSDVSYVNSDRLHAHRLINELPFPALLRGLSNLGDESLRTFMHSWVVQVAQSSLPSDKLKLQRFTEAMLKEESSQGGGSVSAFDSPIYQTGALLGASDDANNDGEFIHNWAETPAGQLVLNPPYRAARRSLPIPDETMCAVFRFLDTGSKWFACAFVCRKWYWLLREQASWSTVSFDGCMRYPTDTVVELPSRPFLLSFARPNVPAVHCDLQAAVCDDGKQKPRDHAFHNLCSVLLPFYATLFQDAGCYEASFVHNVVKQKWALRQKYLAEVSAGEAKVDTEGPDPYTTRQKLAFPGTWMAFLQGDEETAQLLNLRNDDGVRYVDSGLFGAHSDWYAAAIRRDPHTLDAVHEGMLRSVGACRVLSGSGRSSYMCHRKVAPFLSVTSLGGLSRRDNGIVGVPEGSTQPVWGGGRVRFVQQTGNEVEVWPVNARLHGTRYRWESERGVSLRGLDRSTVDVEEVKSDDGAIERKFSGDAQSKALSEDNTRDGSHPAIEVVDFGVRHGEEAPSRPPEIASSVRGRCVLLPSLLPSRPVARLSSVLPWKLPFVEVDGHASWLDQVWSLFVEKKLFLTKTARWRARHTTRSYISRWMQAWVQVRSFQWMVESPHPQTQQDTESLALLPDVLSRLQHLTELNMARRDCGKLLNQIVASPAVRHGRLRSLRLSLPRPPDDAFVALARVRSLRELQLSRVGGISSEGMATLARGCPRLRILRIKSTRALSLLSVAWLSCGFPYLRILALQLPKLRSALQLRFLLRGVPASLPPASSRYPKGTRLAQRNVLTYRQEMLGLVRALSRHAAAGDDVKQLAAVEKEGHKLLRVFDHVEHLKTVSSANQNLDQLRWRGSTMGWVVDAGFPLRQVCWGEHPGNSASRELDWSSPGWKNLRAFIRERNIDFVRSAQQVAAARKLARLSANSALGIGEGVRTAGSESAEVSALLVDQNRELRGYNCGHRLRMCDCVEFCNCEDSIGTDHFGTWYMRTAMFLDIAGPSSAWQSGGRFFRSVARRGPKDLVLSGGSLQLPDLLLLARERGVLPEEGQSLCAYKWRHSDIPSWEDQEPTSEPRKRLHSAIPSWLDPPETLNLTSQGEESRTGTVRFPPAIGDSPRKGNETVKFDPLAVLGFLGSDPEESGHTEPEPSKSTTQSLLDLMSMWRDRFHCRVVAPPPPLARLLMCVRVSSLGGNEEFISQSLFDETEGGVALALLYEHLVWCQECRSGRLRPVNCEHGDGNCRICQWFAPLCPLGERIARIVGSDVFASISPLGAESWVSEGDGKRYVSGGIMVDPVRMEDTRPVRVREGKRVDDLANAEVEFGVLLSKSGQRGVYETRKDSRRRGPVVVHEDPFGLCEVAGVAPESPRIPHSPRLLLPGWSVRELYCDHWSPCDLELMVVSACCTNLRSLRCNASQISDFGCYILSRSPCAPNLLGLWLDQALSISDKGILCLAAQCRRLRCLFLHKCSDMLTDIAVLGLTYGCPLLRLLGLDGADISDAAISYLAGGRCSPSPSLYPEVPPGGAPGDGVWSTFREEMMQVFSADHTEFWPSLRWNDVDQEGGKSCSRDPGGRFAPQVCIDQRSGALSLLGGGSVAFPTTGTHVAVTPQVMCAQSGCFCGGQCMLARRGSLPNIHDHEPGWLLLDCTTVESWKEGELPWTVTAHPVDVKGAVDSESKSESFLEVLLEGRRVRKVRPQEVSSDDLPDVWPWDEKGDLLSVQEQLKIREAHRAYEVQEQKELLEHKHPTFQFPREDNDDNSGGGVMGMEILSDEDLEAQRHQSSNAVQPSFEEQLAAQLDGCASSFAYPSSDCYALRLPNELINDSGCASNEEALSVRTVRASDRHRWFDARYTSLCLSSFWLHWSFEELRVIHQRRCRPVSVSLRFAGKGSTKLAVDIQPSSHVWQWDYYVLKSIGVEMLKNLPADHPFTQYIMRPLVQEDKKQSVEPADGYRDDPLMSVPADKCQFSRPPTDPGQSGVVGNGAALPMPFHTHSLQSGLRSGLFPLEILSQRWYDYLRDPLCWIPPKDGPRCLELGKSSASDETDEKREDFGAGDVKPASVRRSCRVNAFEYDPVRMRYMCEYVAEQRSQQRTVADSQQGLDIRESTSRFDPDLVKASGQSTPAELGRLMRECYGLPVYLQDFIPSNGVSFGEVCGWGNAEPAVPSEKGRTFSGVLPLKYAWFRPLVPPRAPLLHTLCLSGCYLSSFALRFLAFGCPSLFLLDISRAFPMDAPIHMLTSSPSLSRMMTLTVRTPNEERKDVSARQYIRSVHEGQCLSHGDIPVDKWRRNKYSMGKGEWIRDSMDVHVVRKKRRVNFVDGLSTYAYDHTLSHTDPGARQLIHSMDELSVPLQVQKNKAACALLDVCPSSCQRCATKNRWMTGLSKHTISPSLFPMMTGPISDDHGLPVQMGPTEMSDLRPLEMDDPSVTRAYDRSLSGKSRAHRCDQPAFWPSSLYAGISLTMRFFNPCSIHFSWASANVVNFAVCQLSFTTDIAKALNMSQIEMESQYRQAALVRQRELNAAMPAASDTDWAYNVELSGSDDDDDVDWSEEDAPSGNDEAKAEDKQDFQAWRAVQRAARNIQRPGSRKVSPHVFRFGEL